MFLTTNFNTSFCFYVDSVAAGFMFLTVSIAIFVNIYAFAYFRYEPLVERLLVFLNLFVISMVILVTAGNLVLLFLG
jgi:NADH-quinone oxidoreductase subunit L